MQGMIDELEQFALARLILAGESRLDDTAQNRLQAGIAHVLEYPATLGHTGHFGPIHE